MSGAHLLAVGLAVLGAVLFGLAAVRQHGAVHEVVDEMTPAGPAVAGLDLSAVRRLVRQPAWLLGAVQVTAAGACHLVALVLAPLTLVQPLGVLAVPVAVVGSAVAVGRWPGRGQVVGALLGVAGVVGLAVLLLAPADRALAPPSAGVLIAVVLGAAAVGVLVTVRGRTWSALTRCLVLSSVSAVLFGLNAILLRLVGHLVGSGALATRLPLLVTAALGIAVVLPVGLWAMQAAYTVGSAPVVTCCLTLVDPIAAVGGGYLLLHDGVTLPGLSWVGVLAGTAMATVGVVLLSIERRRPTAVGLR